MRAGPALRARLVIGLRAQCSYWAARPLLPQVAEDYIQDDFNLSGLSSQVLGLLPAVPKGASLSSSVGCSGSNGRSCTAAVACQGRRASAVVLACSVVLDWQAALRCDSAPS